jgi:predicted SAM-dependent methyltransferase
MSLKATLRRAVRVVFPDTHFISMLRWELKLAFIHLCARCSPFERAKLRALKSKNNLKLNIGNGQLNHASWTNIDCRLTSDKNSLAFDLRRRWPLPAESVQFIFTEHVFEHFSYPEDINHVLSECRRVLKPGGMLRAIVPDAGRYLRAYHERDERFLAQLNQNGISQMEAVNRVFRENGFHKYAYDYETMKQLLDVTGFREVSRSDFRSSKTADLNLDLDEPERRLESLYVEAVK